MRKQSIAIQGSLRARLLLLLLVIAAASGVAAYLMIEMFRTSVSAQIDRAEAMAGRGCENIVERYRFYAANWQGTKDFENEKLHRDLRAVVELALRDQNGVEGGIWEAEHGPIAYAFPTYEGGGLKTDIPAAEFDRIKAINLKEPGEESMARARYAGRSQTLILNACTLPGPIGGLTAWTMTRVFTGAWDGYGHLRNGLLVLFACVGGAAVLLTQLLTTWSRHVGAIERALGAGSFDLPPLPLTGEKELDRIIGALNRAGERLLEARKQSEQLSSQMAAAERMASIGRMTAAFAHEIRNPIAAMRLKAENALARGGERTPAALDAIIEQIDRLDRLVEQLLSASHKAKASPETVNMPSFIARIAQSHGEQARRLGVIIAREVQLEKAKLDPTLTGRALDNLIANALFYSNAGDEIRISARQCERKVLIDVCDQGPGVDPTLADKIFEPFVTGRADGTGLGLAIANEAVASQGGALRLLPSKRGAHFQIALPGQRNA